MDLLRSIVLGVVEGITEFLPISSTGHMILVQPLLGIDPEKPVWRAFLFLSQTAAALAVLLFFSRELLAHVRRVPARGWTDHLLIKLFVAFLPAAVAGLALNDFMEYWLENPPMVALALIAGALLMEWIDRRYRVERNQTIDDVTLKQAALIGLAQVLSMWPGTSRAMMTILGGMVVGLSPRVATEFSFLLAIPTLGAAGLYRLWKYRNDLSADSALLLLVGCATAFLAALLVIAWLLEYVKRHRFTPFAVYRVVLGAGVLTWWLARG